MNDTDKRHKLAQQTAITQTLRRMGRGVGAIRKDPGKLTALLALWCVLLGLWLTRHLVMGYTADNWVAPLHDLLLGIVLILLALAVPTALSWAWGGPLQAGMIQDNLLRTGLVNHAGEAPILLSITDSTENSKIKTMEFTCVGLPVSIWLDCADKIQTALNRTVTDIRYTADQQHILVTTAPPATVWPTVIYWSDRYLPLDRYVLLLGVGPMGPVTVNLAKIPHVLLGGSTGSGKTVLLKVLLRQAILWGAEVYIADFKGGADFGRWWRDNCEICYGMEALMGMLDLLDRTMGERKVLLRDTDCANIDEYAKKTTRHLRRMIFACDELASLLDKTGQSKAVKEQIDQVVKRLSDIAQQGRAFGLHLVLSTQRPDANLIPGQIRSNIDYKVCGRADSVLSAIIIDSTAAADIIPKDAQGRFIVNDGGKEARASVFQAYCLRDSQM